MHLPAKLPHTRLHKTTHDRQAEAHELAILLAVLQRFLVTVQVHEDGRPIGKEHCIGWVVLRVDADRLRVQIKRFVEAVRFVRLIGELVEYDNTTRGERGQEEPRSDKRKARRQYSM